jgi:hypothetical protein
MPAGRPTKYTAELGQSLCEWIAGGQSLRSWCKAEEYRPDAVTVLRWLREHEELRIQYTQAREDQADGLSDEVMDLARQEKEDPRAAKARADILLAVQARLAPKRYGTQRIGLGQDPDAKPLEVDLSVLPDDLVKKVLIHADPNAAATLGDSD